MTVLHTGSTNKFSSNWSSIFGKGKKSADTATAKPAGKAKKKAAAKQAVAAKKPVKKKKAKK